MKRALAVIGGGAAGFFGAITAARACPALHVILCEATNRPLEKVRISGGGRCNVTHACFDPAELVQHYPRGGIELRGPFTRFHPSHTIDWFSSEGVVLKIETDGRVFPASDRSETIITALVAAANRSGVDIRQQSRVGSIRRRSNLESGFQIELAGGEQLEAAALLLATGSSPTGYQFAQSLGHTITPRVPSLFTFKISDQRLAGLSGVSFPDVKAELLVDKKPVAEHRGPMLITHWGLSGPVILRLSAWGARELHDAGYRAELLLCFAPQKSADDLRRSFELIRTGKGGKLINSIAPIELPKRYWQAVCEQCGIAHTQTWSQVTREQVERLYHETASATFQITGKGMFKEEFVTCGGVELREIDFRTMQSRVCPSLFFAGELLDIDGITGGFNFQNAWTTGWIAGQAIAEKLR